MTGTWPVAECLRVLPRSPVEPMEARTQDRSRVATAQGLKVPWFTDQGLRLPEATAPKGPELTDQAPRGPAVTAPEAEGRTSRDSPVGGLMVERGRSSVVR